MNKAPEYPEMYYAGTMAKAPHAVRMFYTALSERNSKKLRSILTDDFTFKSPLAEFETPEGYVDMVGKFGGWVETLDFIVESNRVAHTFVYHMTDPGVADIPICEVFELKNGLIKSSRAYNNAADFPSPDGC